MREQVEYAIALARGIWRYRWHAMATAWGIVLVGWAVVHYGLVSYYTARAQIYVDTETVLRPLLKGLTLEVNQSEQLGLMARQLMSRPNLEHVIQQTGLDRQGDGHGTPDVVLEELRANISLNAERTSREARYTNFYSISYTNIEPQLAKAVVQSLIDAFALNTLEEIQRDAQRAKLFIEKQLADYKERLTKAENRLRQYKREHVDVLPERGLTYFERLQAEQAALREVELMIRQTESHREKLQGQLDSTPAFVRAMSADGTPVPTSREARLLALQQKLDQLLLKYTDVHPDVIETRESIAQLQQRKARVVGGPSMANPIHQQLELKLKETEAELAGLRTKREIYLLRVEALEQQIETLPQVEDELQRITRDHEIIKDNYKALVARRQSMEISENVEQDSKALRFRVIEPPHVPVDTVAKSTWKKQLLLSTAVLVAGIAGGLALAYLLSQIRPGIYGQRALGVLTGLPVFAVVSEVPTASMRARRRVDMLALAVSGLMMLVAYGASLLLLRGSNDIKLAVLDSALKSMGGMV